MAKIENLNYHSKVFGFSLEVVQKRYGRDIINYCMNDSKDAPYLFVEMQSGGFNSKVLAVFKTKKLHETKAQ